MLLLDKIVLSFAEFTWVKDKIILVDYLNEEPLNVERGIQLVEACKKLSGNQPCVVIHNVTDKYIFTTDALRFMGSQLDTETHKYLARAIVCTNSAARLSSNHFIKAYKPVVPTELFSDLDNALQWASGFTGE
jgi:hypothetical protein